MSKKMQINPDTSYMLGLFHCSKGNMDIGVNTRNEKLVERFAAIAVNDLDIKPDSIRVEINEQEANSIYAHFYNAKIRKLLQKALEEREHIFKYKNEYSASYIAALYDCCGRIGRSGLYISNLDTFDEVLLEKLGFHISSMKKACRIRNAKEFMEFIKDYSIK